MATAHCVRGVRHDGHTHGSLDTVGGVTCYLTAPTEGKVLLYLPDAFGIELANNRLLCDDFARNGFQVVGIDLFGGDPASVDAMDAGTFDFRAWNAKHGPDVTRPYIDAVVAALKQQGAEEFAATGYCFSARYVFDLAFDGVIKVGAVAHPSLLNIPDDLHKYKQTGIPLLINSCEFDQAFPIYAQAQADAILGDGHMKTDLYRREYFAGCTHGFAVRGDLSDPKTKAGKEGSFKATVEFFSQHF